MKKSEITTNIISNSWDDFDFNTEEKRIEIFSAIDEKCSYFPRRGVVLMAFDDEIIGGNSYKKVLDKYAYILFWEGNIPVHLRDEYMSMIEESARRAGLTYLIDFLEIKSNEYVYDIEVKKKVEDGYEIDESIDTVAWVHGLGIATDNDMLPISLVKKL